MRLGRIPAWRGPCSLAHVAPYAFAGFMDFAAAWIAVRMRA